ncbi:MAG: hypothetical protein JO102_03400 [Elusimicrobia bacterium]|nr:hypothetical protein [Elusimicrobiota bacterium]
MKLHPRAPAPASFRKTRRKTENLSQRVYENAWDDCVGYGGPPPPGPVARRWSSIARFSGTRSGRIVMIAPVFGALGAFFLIRRRR